MNEKKAVSIGKAADMLGVCIDTLREWDKTGVLTPIKTAGNHRRYLVTDILKFQGMVVEEDGKPKDGKTNVVCYSRVSSHEQKQKGDLERQSGRLLAFCAKKGYHIVKSFEEVGSGMSDNRPRLKQLFRLVEDKAVTKVVVEHKDRLTRFNFQFLVEYFNSYGVEIEWMEDVLGKSYEQELVEDMLTLMSSFSNRIYGKRSAENRKKKKAELAAVPVIEGVQEEVEPAL